jgi:hypothetical protein
MKSSQPPTLATWLLEHIRFGNTGEALAGDLVEEFRQRRSAAWYWRQVLMALLAGYAKDVGAHWVLAIRASAAGLAASSTATVLGHFVFVALHQSGAIDVRALPRLIPWFLTSFLSGAISGWLVAVLSPRHRAAMFLTFGGALLVWALMGRGVMRIDGNSQRFLTAALTDYLFVLAGVVAGVLATPTPKTGAPSRLSW